MKSGWLPPPPALPPRPSASQVCNARARWPSDPSNKGGAPPSELHKRLIDGGRREAAADGRVSSSPPQVSPFVSGSEKTPLKMVQQPNFADFSHFREEVSSVKRDVLLASVAVRVSDCSEEPRELCLPEGRKTKDG